MDVCKSSRRRSGSRGSEIDFGFKAALEFRLGAERPRPEEVNEMEDFQKVVLDGRGSEQKEKFSLEIFDQFVTFGRCIAQMMRFIDDDHIVIAGLAG